ARLLCKIDQRTDRRCEGGLEGARTVDRMVEPQSVAQRGRQGEEQHGDSFPGAPRSSREVMHYRFRSTRSLALAFGVLALTSGIAAQQKGGDPEAAKIKNPVAATPESIAEGEKTFQSVCAPCHGKNGKGGITISVIEDRGGNPPPDLTDDKWD